MRTRTAVLALACLEVAFLPGYRAYACDFMCSTPAAQVVIPAGTLSNTNHAQQNTRNIPLGVIPKGTTITVQTCGTFAVNGDTFLRVFRGATGNRDFPIGSSDDECGSATSTFTFVTSASDHYWAAIGCFSNLTCNPTATISTTQSMLGRWAPAIFHDTGSPLHYDYITKFNFDGDNSGLNNYNNATSTASLYPAYVYYSYVETYQHRYISFYFFHPYDDASDHENDLESATFMIRKNDAAGDRLLFGDLIAVQVARHGGIYYSQDDLGITNVNISNVTYVSDAGSHSSLAGRVRLWIEPGGHGAWVCSTQGSGGTTNCNTPAPGNTGLVYGYKASAEYPGQFGTNNGSGDYSLTSPTGYALINATNGGDIGVFADSGTPGLHALRFNWYTMYDLVIQSAGKIKGNDPEGSNSAQMPWGHGMGAQGATLCHPAWNFNGNLTGSPVDNISFQYVSNYFWNGSTGVEGVGGYEPPPYSCASNPGVLLSEGKAAFQSSMWGNNPAGRAVDGNTDGNFNVASMNHTDQQDFPQWRVDLGSIKDIRHVEVWNRTDACGVGGGGGCANRLQEWSVWVSNEAQNPQNWTKIFNDSTAAGALQYTQVKFNGAAYNGTNAGVTLAGPWSAQHVMVQINRTQTFLHVPEVRVWGF